MCACGDDVCGVCGDVDDVCGVCMEVTCVSVCMEMEMTSVVCLWR